MCLFDEMLQSFGGARRRCFEDFVFVVSLAVGDHAVNDARQFVRGGNDALCLAEPGLEPTAKLADFVVAAVRQS